MSYWMNMQQDSTASTLVFMPSRLRMSLRLIMNILYVAGTLLLILFLSRSEPEDVTTTLGALLVVLLDSLFVINCLLIVYWIVRPAPCITISKEGVVDNASLIYRGLGLIRWSDISAVWVFTYSFNTALMIRPSDWQRYSEKMSLWLRVQRWWITKSYWSRSSYVCIPQYMLPQDARFVRLDISTAYYQWHPHTDGPISFD